MAELMIHRLLDFGAAFPTSKTRLLRGATFFDDSVPVSLARRDAPSVNRDMSQDE